MIVSDCSAQDLVLIPNVTTGTSTVVQEVVRSLSPGDRILVLNLTYGMITQTALCIFEHDNLQENSVGPTKKLLRHMEDTHGVIVDEAVIQFPIHSGSEVKKIFATDKIICCVQIVKAVSKAIRYILKFVFLLVFVFQPSNKASCFGPHTQ